MAYKYREDLVGKRFLSVSGATKFNVNKVTEWGWKAGVIRAASVKDNNNKELQVLVEYDGVDWQRREWVAVYSRRTFRVFLVENTLVWGPRSYEGEEVKWPALTFSTLSSEVNLPSESQPIEFLHDKKLKFVDYAQLHHFQDWDPNLAGAEVGVDAALLTALSSEAALWKSTQDGQRILTTTPSVLGGCRAQVYRAAGATQWYTAVIVGVNEHTGELTVTDDTVLEEHSEDPALVQMTLLGDGVVESIMRGEVVGVMPRRSRSSLQRIERESAKSPAGAGRKKSAATVKSNGQLTPSDPPPDTRPAPANEIEPNESTHKGASGDVSESVQDKCSKDLVSACVSVSSSADAGLGAVASEEDDCVIVCDADRGDPALRAMAHGYGGGPPPPLLHLPPTAPALYTDLLWKQRAYQPQIHPQQIHHALTEDYLAYDRERHERLLRERRDQERDLLEKQQKEKERERMEREREREKQEREERERREEKERQENAASKLVSRHFEESLSRLANQKRNEQRNMSWNLINSLSAARAVAPDHERLRTDRGYLYSPPHPQRAAKPSDYCRLPTKPPDKPPSLPKGEPNFAGYSFSPYRGSLKEAHLPAPPPLVPEPNSVIVKHDAKQIHLEQKHPYPPKRAEAPSHYGRPPYRASLSPHHPAPAPAPHSPHQQHATHPQHVADKTRARQYPQPAPPRSPAFYPSPPAKPKVSSPAPPHIYGKPGSSPTPAHYAEPPLPLSKTGPPVPYPPPSAYSPAPRARPPPAAHSRTPEPRPPPRAHQASPPAAAAPSPCQTQPLDLGVSSREDPDRLSPRRRFPFDPASDPESKRRRLDSGPAPPARPASEPLIASAAGALPGRPPLGSEPTPQPPGPACDVRVPSADGSVETPERAAGASPAPQPSAPAASPVASSPPAAPAPPAPPATPPAAIPAEPTSTPAPSPKEGAQPPVRHLGKKAWLQRHETAPIGEGDCSGGGGVCVTLPMTVATRAPTPEDTVVSNIVIPVAAKSIQRVPTPNNASRPKTSKPRKPTKETNGRLDDDEGDSSSTDREPTTLAKRKPPKAKRKKNSALRKGSEDVKKKKASESGSESDKESDDKDSDSGSGGSGGARRGRAGARGRRARGGRGRRRDDPPRRAAAPRAKTAAGSTDSFLQNGPCFEVAPRLAKCRECLLSPAQRDKDMPNIFCRFYAFRRLKYAKNRQLAIAGFSDPHKDADDDDKKLWLSSSADAAELDIEMSCFLLREIGDQFCQLLQEEKEAESLHLNEDKTIAWKRVVQGVREMCDVCETTLFNFHWTCGKCGFVVCLDCYKSRTVGNSISNSEVNTSSSPNPNEERDSHGWLTCTSGGVHPPRRLLLTQIAAGGALTGMAARAHRARLEWGLPPCQCNHNETDAADPSRRARARELLQKAVAKNIKEEKKEENGPTNGTSPVKSENGKTVMSWLADIPIKSENKDKDKSDSSSSDEDGNFSTLRELLIRPAPDSGETQPKKKQKKNEVALLADVISSVVPETKDEDVKQSNSTDVVKRYGKVSDSEPIRFMTHLESKMLYPDVPHAWLCDGKLLHLTDPVNPGNYKPFQNQWKRGQPVLVSDLSNILDKSLWNPASFSRDFGDNRVDVVNCASGLVVPNLPARKFWDGFERCNKRLRDDNDAPLVLKLKDWPPGEDFAELMPGRFDDLMRALPLAEYTSRAGRLNLAARLPDCFVRPDLGPKMYTAYGGASGTTNLHVDVSDAVNVLVHASAPADAPDRLRDAERAAERANLDVLSARRARSRPPAALWHVYEARDADKIRDFLIGVESERGVRPREQHDPVHDQTWYLDARLRERLYSEYRVEGYAVLQCPGDAVFVPAGAPHQVRNLLDCIKVAEDFVSPENVSRCFELAQQFRRLSRRHANKEDKLQIKNIVYHAVKDSLCCLEAALSSV